MNYIAFRVFSVFLEPDPQGCPALPPEPLLERRKQAIVLHRKGETRIEILKVVGVNRNAVGQWISK